MPSTHSLLQQLYTGLDQHNHKAMDACYHPNATFRDIAFDLNGKKQIHAMWHMICDGDIRATFNIVQADEQNGTVNLVDDYTFSSTGRRVHNVIDSRLRFRDGLIIEHHDSCDPRVWAEMALGGAGGWLAGRFRVLRSFKAGEKLRAFIVKHPEYQ